MPRRAAAGDRAPVMADVARIAGVSHQTGSRVLDDHPNVRSEARDRAAYVSSSILAGLVGVLVIGRMNVADPTVGSSGWELTAIAAAVVGGVSLFGGEGRITGIAAGAILLEFISNGLLALHVSAYDQQMVQGAVLGLAILLDRVRARRFGRSRA